MAMLIEKRTRLRDISTEMIDQHLVVYGWIRTIRKQKTFAFIEINDGSQLRNLQIIANDTVKEYEKLLEQASTGASIKASGTIVRSPGGKQAFEMQLETFQILGTCPETYPLQKKRHSPEFMRTIAHLRARTNTGGAVARVRNQLAFATHKFFQARGFLYLHSPIITASDCEGAGELFQVTTLPLDNPPKNKEGRIDFSEDFFSKAAYLTVSGQLNAESYATALSDVYTFGPTFRAENSHTSRHLAEFWMIEPEMAFADLMTIQESAESYVKFLINEVLTHCEADIEFFTKFYDKELKARLDHLVASPFEKITYTEAVEILIASKHPFEYKPSWGIDLQSEHERFLSEQHFKKPVIVTDYPKEIKAFYMRENEDRKTVAAMDVIVPKIGELIGGSQREERLDVLEERIREGGLDLEPYSWYLDLRRFGTVPHAGYGLGFERLVQFVTGIDNIRDVIPFPRVPGNADF